MLRTPPHILVTTPESLYLLLTSDRSRAHVADGPDGHRRRNPRGDRHAARRASRAVARTAATGRASGRCCGSASPRRRNRSKRSRAILVGASERAPARSSTPVIVGRWISASKSRVAARGGDVARGLGSSTTTGSRRSITAHRTTLVFVNTRRMAERLARHLSDRLGEDAVTAHHGSLSKETRLDAETRLKAGTLRALVATASLELGIDIGHVDLVCQIGSPHRIATLLQRVGRSGHTIAGLPKGRVFPTSRDDLIECAALLRSVRRGRARCDRRARCAARRPGATGCRRNGLRRVS